VQGGLGAEIAASVTTAAFASLDAPVLRVGAPFAPPPAGPELEAMFVPSPDRVATAIRELLARKTGRSVG
jgi:acetoin:2,6-dichlorophenolindophenol oxidoreductase subunit beta